MSSTLKKILLLATSTLACLIFLLVGKTTFAQSEVQGAATMGVAKIVETSIPNIKDGSIVSLSQNKSGAILSSTPYDPQAMGVVSRNAAMLIDTGEKNTVPVIADGTVYLLVSSQQGKIKKGDLLTTSTIPGVAVKADQSGYVLGEALENYDNPNPAKTDLIAVDLNLHYTNTKPTLLGSLTDILKFALLPSKTSTSPIWKYIVAAVVVLASFVLGFMTFGRTAAKGVEALGRNPSAGRIIHLGIIFNVVIVIIIVLAGLTISFLILRL